MEEKVFRVLEQYQDMRLDKFLAEVMPDHSRNYIQSLIKEGKVLVEGKREKASYKVVPDEEIIIKIPPAKEMSLQPEDIELDIIYEDSDIIVINKSRDMVVHPAPSNYSGTLVNALLFHCKDLSGIGGVQRPGIVHRLDKDTSGVIIVAKNDLSHQELKRQFKERRVKKIYLAVVHGYLTHKKGKIVAPIGRDPYDRKKMAVVQKGKKAVTLFEVMEELAGYSLVRVRIKTGRTHQIRVHFAFLNHPVVGDEKYGQKKKTQEVKGQLLHAHKLILNHPRTGKKMEFEAPIPEDMIDFINRNRK